MKVTHIRTMTESSISSAVHAAIEMQSSGCWSDTERGIEQKIVKMTNVLSYLIELLNEKHVISDQETIDLIDDAPGYHLEVGGGSDAAQE